MPPLGPILTHARRYPLRAVLVLRQDGSIRNYLRTFELLAAMLEGVSEHVQESTFINGLKLEI